MGLEITRHQAINSIAPGGTIVHIGLTQPSGSFNFKKLTIQEVTLVGTYCYTNKDFKNGLEILKEKKLGDLGWIEYRDLKKGAEAFKEIHDGTCVAPKIILILRSNQSLYFSLLSDKYLGKLFKSTVLSL